MARSGSRLGRIARRLVVLVVLVAVAAYGYVGWKYSQELLVPDHDVDYSLEVVAAGDGAVTLPRTDATTDEGVIGLDWADGYGQVSDIRDTEAGRVTRAFRSLDGVPSAGEHVRLDGAAYEGDPRHALGLDYREVSIDAEAGPMPAWLLPGSDDTWVILVHGRGASRSEALRILPTIAQAGHPALVITYRNDADSAPSDDGLYHLGYTEWRDLHAAAEYAMEHGADSLVLYGYSMGGQIVAMFLHGSRYAEDVHGVVFDAPVLDWDATLALQARERGLPTWLVPAAKIVTTLRTGVRWGPMDQVERVSDFAALPVLLFHGTDDHTVPVTSSDSFAAGAEQVEYVRVDGAEHVRSWNVDPDAYEDEVRDFLEEVGS